MSLLIKALDHLEKNKQADKDKKQTGAYVADEALSLELVPIDSKAQEAEIAEQAPVVDAAEASVKTVGAPPIQNLTLEEEAGLTDAPFVANQYAKPKPATKTSSKSVVETKPLQSSTQETLQSERVKSKATAANQTPARQMVNDELNQKAAAKVFVANKEAKAPSSKIALISLGVVGALLVLLGLQGYDYFKRLTTPDVVVLKPSVPQPQVAVVTPPPTPVEMAMPTPEASTQEQQAENQVSASNSFDNKTGTAVFRNKTLDKSNVIEDVIEAELKKPSGKNDNKNNAAISETTDTSYAEPVINNKQKSLTLISKVQSQGVDPTLLAAYQAFTRGEDANAQQQYRQVLQRDVRNVDALLGMAAIAQRQGRDADAQGWYQKVLEIEPRNGIAQTAIISRQTNIDGANTDAVGTESRIKSMIAQQPEGANLHAALGNLYAEQNQWPSAQEAYFNASRLAPNNADYAFNLAISLDQMGKSSLALKQYQRALDLLNKSGGTSPDRAQLEARIRELQ